jgi:F-type H+-transporting ATPase subunit epsilon
MTLTVRVIAPDKTVWDKAAQEVILPSTTGQLGILTGHAPLITALEAGVMRVREEQGWKAIAVMGGFAEVDNNELKVLVNAAEIGDEIDLAEAQATFKSADSDRQAAEKSGNRQQQIQATQAYKRARARLQAAGGLS